MVVGLNPFFGKALPQSIRHIGPPPPMKGIRHFARVPVPSLAEGKVPRMQQCERMSVIPACGTGVSSYVSSIMRGAWQAHVPTMVYVVTNASTATTAPASTSAA